MSDMTDLYPWYGVAATSRLLKITGLFCKRDLWKRRYSAKEAYHFKEPTHRSHPICLSITTTILQIWDTAGFCDMSHSCIWYDSVVCVTWLIYTCVMTLDKDKDSIHVRHDSFICLTWAICKCDMTHPYVWHDSRWWRRSYICGIWHVPMCDMTHSYEWHDSFICVIWLPVRMAILNMWDMSHTYLPRCSFICVTWHNHATNVRSHKFISVWHESFINVTLLIYMRDMTYPNVWHDSRPGWRSCVGKVHSYVSRDSFICVTWHIHVCDMIHSHVLHDKFTCVTWLSTRTTILQIFNCTHSYEWQVYVYIIQMCDTYMDRYIHSVLYVFVSIYACLYMHMHIYIQIYKCMDAYKYMYIYVHVYIQICMPTYIYVPLYVFICMCMYMYE